VLSFLDATLSRIFSSVFNYDAAMQRRGSLVRGTQRKIHR